MNKIKFLVFADLHHYPGIFYTNAEEKLEKIKKRAIEKLAEMSKNQFGDSVIRVNAVEFTENNNGILARCTYICKENIEIDEKILIN